MRLFSRATLIRSSGSGFTMIELLVSMLLLMIVLVGLAALQLQVVRGVSSSRRSDEATRLGQAVLERYMSQNLSRTPLTATGGAFVTQLDANSNPMTAVNVDGIVDTTQPGPFSVSTMIEQLTSDLTWLITVKVTWAEGTAAGAVTPSSVVLTTRRSP